MKILIAEDDDNLGFLLTTFLKAKGYDVIHANNGISALKEYRDNPSRFHFVILDVMMPELDGFSVAKELRLLDNKIPILFLTAKSLETDKLKGFEIGADDYLIKPFVMEELLARIKAILRRTDTVEQIDEIIIGQLKFNPAQNLLFLKGGAAKLTTKENALLNILARNINQVVDRQAALRTIWGDDSYFNGRSMDVYIAKLRKLLNDDPNIEILNVHGVGFKLIVK
ncbi:MAG TPA: DNA-binding response regulator [Crocinitomicaceae bacterium]|nr:DNA-binding response regulator [Crocinitomicaceae bacterium]